jgi:hypothetical protein
MGKTTEDMKTFNMKMPKETWMFLKQTAATQEESMSSIILKCVEKFKKRVESKLTQPDTNV